MLADKIVRCLIEKDSGNILLGWKKYLNNCFVRRIFVQGKSKLSYFCSITKLAVLLYNGKCQNKNLLVRRNVFAPNKMIINFSKSYFFFNTKQGKIHTFFLKTRKFRISWKKCLYGSEQWNCWLFGALCYLREQMESVTLGCLQYFCSDESAFVHRYV